MDLKNIKVIGLDADDTLWSNEPYFREGEENFVILWRHTCPDIVHTESYLPRK
jgi:FMN phosphatase YigB (HAD superfamily)